MRNKFAVTGHPALLPAVGKFLFPVPPPLAPETKCPFAAIPHYQTKPASRFLFIPSYVYSQQRALWFCGGKGQEIDMGPVIALLSKPSLVLSAPEGGGFFLNCLSYRTFISNEKNCQVNPTFYTKAKAALGSCLSCSAPLGIFSDTVGKPLWPGQCLSSEVITKESGIC